MVLNTRRRALGLLLAATAALRLPAMPRALAQAKKKECFESKAFAPWKAQASNSQAGARINEVSFVKPCSLRVEVQVAASYESKIVVYGDPDEMPLPKKFLIKPENRLIVRTGGGRQAIDEPLCGNCNAIEEDKFSIVLPLSTVPLLRDSSAIEVIFRLEGQRDSGFRLTLGNMRKALLWAGKRKAALAQQAAEGKCVPPGIEE